MTALALVISFNSRNNKCIGIFCLFIVATKHIPISILLNVAIFANKRKRLIAKELILRQFDAILVCAFRFPAKIHPFRLIRAEQITKCSMLIEDAAQKHKKKQTDERMHSSEL